MKPCRTCESTLRYENKRCVPCARRFASQYSVTNKERRRAYSKKWYAENHEYARNKNKEWERDNLNQRLAYNHKRRARKNGAPGSHSAKDMRRLRESCEIEDEHAVELEDVENDALTRGRQSMKAEIIDLLSEWMLGQELTSTSIIAFLKKVEV